jgi:hypothetical protein
MFKSRLKKWCLAGVIAITAILFAVFWPLGPIEGCYLSPEPLIATHELLLFRDGNVYHVMDLPHPISPKIANLGSYRFESGVGWVWRLRLSGRRIICKPSLLAMRFRWDDADAMPATEPFRWRDPHFRKIERIMQSETVKAFLSTNTIVNGSGSAKENALPPEQTVPSKPHKNP